MSAGHVRKRGAHSYELKFDLGTDPKTGRRRSRYVSFRGTKRAAELELARLVAEASNGAGVDPSKVTVAEFLDRWAREWAAASVSPKTMERYAEIIRLHIAPRLGALPLQKLRPVDLAELYGALTRDGRGEGRGLAARTVGHVHRVLHRALGHAVAWSVVTRNVAAAVRPPRAVDAEVEIVRDDQVAVLLRRLRDQAIYPIAALALATGMRRGELLALRWRDLDLDRAVVRVERALEVTGAGLRLKEPKTRHGRRAITVPPAIVAELHAHRAAVHERRLALGLGKARGDGLVFPSWDCTSPMNPASVSKEWARTMKAIGMTGIHLHALRHTHASQLIASGLDVLTVSRRLGHGSAAITLQVYGHLFVSTDDRAAQILEATFAAAARTE